MKQFSIDKVENVQITLDTVKGLSQTFNDLISDSTTLFTNYPSTDKGKRYQAKRLWFKLLTLSNASEDTINQAEKQLNEAVSSYYKGDDDQ